MGKRALSRDQLALPVGVQDAALAQMATDEVRRTAVSAAKELRSAQMISAVTGMTYQRAVRIG